MGSREQGSTERQPDLAEQVAAIKPGDTVTARFKTDYWGEFSVTGVVSEDVEHWKGVAGHQLANRHCVVLDTLVAIESHEPAKPPVPPEPQGDYLLREPSGQVSVPTQPGVLMRQDDGARLYWDTVFRYHGTDLKVYRPELSPYEIEKLASKHAKQDHTTTRQAIAAAIREAFGGERS